MAERPYRRWLGVAPLLAAAAALALAACSGPSSPQVASLGASAGGGGRGSPAGTPESGDPGPASSPAAAPTAAPTAGNPTQLLDEWATCMRRNGDPNQADPTIDADKVIHISISPSVRGGAYGYSGEYGAGGPGVACAPYLDAAQTALQGGQSPAPPPRASLEKYSQCMRANGVPDFPDPSNDTLSFSMHAGDVNPNSPTFQNASKLCATEYGVNLPSTGNPAPGTVELNGGGLLGSANSGANSGAGANG
jgi:hypothetical protein